MKSTTRFSTAIIAFSLAAPVLSNDYRWYSPAQATAGESVYRENCLSCHLENGAGTDDWKSRDSEGKLPPPPLDGSAHAWHHDLGVLARTIVEGGAKLGGSMPGFGNKLSEREIVEVIAYVQSLWPDEIYQRWSQRHPDDAASGLAFNRSRPTEDRPEHPMLAQLSTLLPAEREIGAPEPTPVEGIFAVRAGGRYFHLDDSGRYLFTGDLVDLTTGKNLTRQRFTAVRRELMERYPESDKIIFAANGQQKAVVDIFTDPTCPYCRRLHQEVPQLQASGVTVRYLPFPRNGVQGEGYDQLRSVLCAEDRNKELTDAKSRPDYRPGTTDCPAASAVSEGYNLGIEVGVSGTPATVLEDGTLLPGYMPANKLLGELGIGRE